MNARETAWRMFATELNSSSLEIKATEEKSPSYLISPLGAKVNRVLIAGALTEKENIGGDDEPMWKARVQEKELGIMTVPHREIDCHISLPQMVQDKLLLQLQKVDHIAVFAFIFTHFFSSFSKWGARFSA